MENIARESEREIIVQNIKFAKNLAKRFWKERKNINVEVEEYEGAAMLGLCDAARRFDEGKNFQFRTFSYLRIRGAMCDLLRGEGYIPRRSFKVLIQSGKQKVPGSEEYGYTITNSVKELLSYSSVLSQMGYKIYAKGESVQISYAGSENTPEGFYLSKERFKEIHKLLTLLTPNERRVIEMRYLEGYTLDETAELFGSVSKSWISRIQERALKKLKSAYVGRMPGREFFYAS